MNYFIQIGGAKIFEGWPRMTNDNDEAGSRKGKSFDTATSLIEMDRLKFRLLYLIQLYFNPAPPCCPLVFREQ